MEYNKLAPSTFFYAIVWRHVVRFLSECFMRISSEQYATARVTIDELVRTKPTPHDLDEWYRSHSIEYISERVDNIKTPEIFLRDGGGDCDDFVEFSHLILTASGYRCRRLFLTGSAPAHVVTVAYRAKKYFIMDTYACYEVDTLEEVLRYFVDDGLSDYLLL